MANYFTRMKSLKPRRIELEEADYRAILALIEDTENPSAEESAVGGMVRMILRSAPKMKHPELVTLRDLFTSMGDDLTDYERTVMGKISAIIDLMEACYAAGQKKNNRAA